METFIDNSKISWNTPNNETVSICIEDLFLSVFDKSTGLILVKAGKNFIMSKLYGFFPDGKFFFEFTLNNGLEWEVEGKKYTIRDKYLTQVLCLVDEPPFLLLFKYHENDEIRIISKTGETIYAIHSELNRRFEYASKNNHDINVVVNHLDEEDSFGRYQFNYTLNHETRQLTKIGINY